MASKTIEEYLKTASPEQLAELKKDGQDLQRNGVALKPEFQTTAPRAAQTRTTEPPEQMPKQEQRGAGKIQQAMQQSQQPKAAEPSKAQEKAPEHER
ncbi:hypothetical protein [Spirosoma sp. 209]|uniref:hypothetical protein n=1 Tax=Spirosoma sp. 209 TaxID=1955701 RepID=UPI00098D50A7|nr:hypothetical protein [Spirosoma sp. 209]